MIKGKDGRIFTISKVMAGNVITITVPLNDWKFFELGARVRIIGLNGQELIRRVRAIGQGRQRVLSIPQDECDIFKKGDKVKLYPLKVAKISKSQQREKMTNKQNGKQVYSKE